MGILQFSAHFQLICDNSNVNKRQTQNSGSGGRQIFIEFIYNLQNNLTILLHPSKRNFFLIKSYSYQMLTFLLNTSKTYSNIKLFAFFRKLFLRLIFATKIKINVGEITSCFVGQLTKKYCVYYVSEHLTYCDQINYKL